MCQGGMSLQVVRGGEVPPQQWAAAVSTLSEEGTAAFTVVRPMS